ncbi:uncharacterized protein EV422DRAFT_566069 [Fimicolochytrium jonesii]|uniref:uncharacterized protein n=1 Tax=Fimicolochytrium jonesii TaxID=1396493 RepID=UPI0022FF4085|nr:uncharacterized protein EV422DRAFT_566069 [Fimicolochytrium jonesii]KAI8822373.1 hypothetical protein EV422DRAFT_566069 [Fimicolochytrium jonesii]
MYTPPSNCGSSRGSTPRAEDSPQRAGRYRLPSTLSDTETIFSADEELGGVENGGDVESHAWSVVTSSHNEDSHDLGHRATLLPTTTITTKKDDDEKGQSYSHTGGKQQQQQTSRIEHFDGLRGILALIVASANFLRHFDFVGGVDARMWPIFGRIVRYLGLTPLPISLFFLLSGRVLMIRYLENPSLNKVASAFLRRPFRLLIPVMGSLLVMWAMVHLRLCTLTAQAAEHNTIWIPVDEDAKQWCRNDWFPFSDIFSGAVAFLVGGHEMPFPDRPQQTIRTALEGSFLLFAVALVMLAYPKSSRTITVVLATWFTFTSSVYAHFMWGFLIAQQAQAGVWARVRISRAATFWKSTLLFVALTSMYFRDPYMRIAKWTTWDINEGHWGRSGSRGDQWNIPEFYTAVAIMLGLELSPGLCTILSSRPFLFLGRISVGLYLLHPVVYTVVGSLVGAWAFDLYLSTWLQATIVYIGVLGAWVVAGQVFANTFDKWAVDFGRFVETKTTQGTWSVKGALRGSYENIIYASRYIQTLATPSGFNMVRNAFVRYNKSPAGKFVLATNVVSTGLMVVITLYRHWQNSHVPVGLMNLWDGRGNLPLVTGTNGILRTTTDGPAPVCVINVWERGHLPTYVRAALDSMASRNGSAFMETYLFVPSSIGVDGVKKLYDGKNAWPANVHVVDLGMVNERWASESMDQYVADNLCRMYDLPLTSWECWRVRRQTLDSAKLKGRPSNLVQFRMAFGSIFKPWVDTSRCSSWAWGDLDTLWGDLRSVYDSPLVKDADIVTLGGGDRIRLYTRGQYTALNQRINPAVNDIWRKCSEFATLTALTTFMRRDSWMALDEGCTTDAAHRSGIKFVIVNSQFADWGNALVMSRAQHGRVYNCYGRPAERDLAIAKQNKILVHSELIRAQCTKMLEVFDAKLQTGAYTRPFTADLVPVPQNFTYGVPPHGTGCSSWVPADANWCVLNMPVEPDWETGPRVIQSMQMHPNTPNNTGQWYAFPRPSDPIFAPQKGGVNNDVELFVLDSALTHLQNYKRNMQLGDSPLMHVGVVEAGRRLREGDAYWEVYPDTEAVFGEPEWDPKRMPKVIWRLGEGK